MQISEKFTDIEFDEKPSVYSQLFPCGQTVTRSKVTNIRIKSVAHNGNFYQFIHGYMFRL